jgi:hypothetical protein
MNINTLMRYNLKSVKMVISKKMKISAGKATKKRNPCVLLLGMQINTASTENSVVSPQKTKNRIAMQSSNATLGYISKGTEIGMLKRYFHSHFYSSIIPSSHTMKAT